MACRADTVPGWRASGTNVVAQHVWSRASTLAVAQRVVAYLRAADNVSGPLPNLAAWHASADDQYWTCVFETLSIPVDLPLSTRRLLSSR